VHAGIAKFAAAHLRLVSAMRRWLRKRLPTAHEVVYEYRDCFVISYSPSERGYEGVLAIVPVSPAGEPLGPPRRITTEQAHAPSFSGDSKRILYQSMDKLRLIERTFREFQPEARSFADLGGAWKVNGAYSIHAVKNCGARKGSIVDTDFSPAVLGELARFPSIEAIRDDFASERVISRIGTVDVIFLFDVLLHQANPDWDEILRRYAAHCPCFVIYNQQLVQGAATIRLTDLPYDEYVAIASDHASDTVRHVYGHRDEIHPLYGKPWKDIHNISQWGITDAGLRSVMSGLGYREAYFRNHGIFVGLPAFEEHAFVFVRG